MTLENLGWKLQLVAQIIRRNGKCLFSEKAIIGYAQGTILHGQESSPLATDIALRILRHTGGRLTAPILADDLRFRKQQTDTCR